MDGTIFNTESVHAHALLKMATIYQIKVPHPPEVIHSLMIGKADHYLFEILKDWDGIPKHWTLESFVKEKNDHILELLKLTPLESYFCREMQELLKVVKTQGFYLALVTSSEKIVTNELLKIAGLENHFHLVLTRDDCPHHKPDPWPYLKASEISGFEKHEVLIFEDSQVGLEAATLSGHQVIKVEWY
jgi:HAD superfamily hydrolase (TIGR01509 family)